MTIRDFPNRPFVILAAVAAGSIVAAGVLASLAFGTDAATKTVTVNPCGDRIFGHIKSLERSGDHYLLRFDPASFTSGVTANTAAAEDGAVEPGQPVPNDNYVVDESDRLLTYLVPETANVTILTTGGTQPLYQTQSSVARCSSRSTQVSGSASTSTASAPSTSSTDREKTSALYDVRRRAILVRGRRTTSEGGTHAAPDLRTRLRRRRRLAGCLAARRARTVACRRRASRANRVHVPSPGSTVAPRKLPPRTD
jgi:hypothetical protein